MTRATWSETLRQQTRDILAVPPALAGQFVPIKHTDGRFALVSRETDGRGFIAVDRRDGALESFASISELLDEGWAVD